MLLPAQRRAEPAVYRGDSVNQNVAQGVSTALIYALGACGFLVGVALVVLASFWISGLIYENKVAWWVPVIAFCVLVVGGATVFGYVVGAPA